jgi:hypothetical protein
MGRISRGADRQTDRQKFLLLTPLNLFRARAPTGVPNAYNSHHSKTKGRPSRQSANRPSRGQCFIFGALTRLVRTGRISCISRGRGRIREGGEKELVHQQQNASPANWENFRPGSGVCVTVWLYPEDSCAGCSPDFSDENQESGPVFGLQQPSILLPILQANALGDQAQARNSHVP